MEEMTALLTQYNLQQYADAFEAKGYDDVRYIFTCAARADADVLLGQARLCPAPRFVPSPVMACHALRWRPTRR